MSFNVVVLASGTGSLFEALIQSQQDYEVVALITDNPDAGAIAIADTFGIQVEICDLDSFSTRTDWNSALRALIAEYQPDLVVSAGFMKVIGEQVVNEFNEKLINIHPSLLPNFPGAHAVEDALNAGVTRTGTTVHFVDAGVDSGPIIAQREVEISQNDSIESLHERIKTVERELIVEVVKSFAREATQ